jgi:competence transcription factor ComK
MMMLYNKTISISKWHSIIDHGAKFICGTLNGNTHETLHIIIMIYKPPKMQIDYFISIQKHL